MQRELEVLDANDLSQVVSGADIDRKLGMCGCGNAYCLGQTHLTV